MDILNKHKEYLNRITVAFTRQGMNLKFFVNLLILVNISQCQILDTSRHVIHRQKRWLVWHNDGSNWVQFIFGLGIPLEIKHEAITIGTVMKAFYLLPTNSTVYTHPSIDYERKKRSTTRWVLYEMLESYMQRYKNVDGKACLLKSICENSQVPFDERSGVLAEVIHAVLTPSTTDSINDNQLETEYHAAEKLGKVVDNCDVLFPECEANFMQQFSSLLIN